MSWLEGRSDTNVNQPRSLRSPLPSNPSGRAFVHPLEWLFVCQHPRSKFRNHDGSDRTRARSPNLIQTPDTDAPSSQHIATHRDKQYRPASTSTSTPHLLGHTLVSSIYSRSPSPARHATIRFLLQFLLLFFGCRLGRGTHRNHQQQRRAAFLSRRLEIC